MKMEIYKFIEEWEIIKKKENWENLCTEKEKSKPLRNIEGVIFYPIILYMYDPHGYM